MRRRSCRLLLAAQLLSVLLAGCKDDSTPDNSQIPLPVFVTDPGLQPTVAALPGASGATRPVAAIADSSGTVANFVEQEIILVTDTDSELQAFLQRWKGTLIQTIDPNASVDGQPPEVHLDLPRIHHVRIDAAGVDASKLVDDLRSKHAQASGQHRLSSSVGLATLAAAAREAAAGRSVGLNFVMQGDNYRDRQLADAPNGPSGYTPNAFDWYHMKQGGPLDIGVAEAWRALDIAGRLRTSAIKVAIIDGGFWGEHADYPPGPDFTSAAPGVTQAWNHENTMSCGGSPCPWHGMASALTAFGVPGNGYAGAGPAGPIARPYLIAALGDMVTGVYAVTRAAATGAKVINMSWGVPVPAGVSAVNAPFEITTMAVRAAGVLMFASAGNDGLDVDREDCVPLIGWPCWESVWVTPCENKGVICVGGTNSDAATRHGHSAYGSKNEGDSVDIAGPFTVYGIGARADDSDPSSDPTNPQPTTARSFSGTSASSPFVAGVAALVWAANPSMSADQVWGHIAATVHPLPGTGLKGLVNAYGAVIRALGGVPDEQPNVRITSPANNAVVEAGQSVTFIAEVTDREDPSPCCSINWSSSVDGAMGGGRTVSFTFTTPGSRTIMVTARDSKSGTATASITINVGAPTVEAQIVSPPSGTSVYRGTAVNLSGIAHNTGAADNLPCTSLRWESVTPGSGDTGLPATGCTASVTFGSNGMRQVRLTGTNSFGTTGTATVDISVVDPPVVLPPQVTISVPAYPGQQYLDNKTPISLVGKATSPSGNPLNYEWTWTNGKVPVPLGKAESIVWVPQDSGIGCTKIYQSYYLSFKAADSKTGLSGTATTYIVLQCPPP